MFETIRRRAAGALVLAMSVGAAATWAGAGEEKVELGKVPHYIQQEIEKATKGGSHVQVIKISEEGRPEEDYFVSYLDAKGKEMKLRLGPTGKVIEQGEQHKDEARLGQIKNEKERAQFQDELAAKREKEDRARFEAYNAAHAKEAAVHAENADRSFAGVKEMSEEYNSKDLHRISASELPPGVRKTFDMETLGTRDVDYSRYTVAGKTFYSAHYNTGADRRMVCRVDDTGKLLGKNELRSQAAPPAIEDRAASVVFDQLPPNIRETMKRETQGGRDMAYYRITRGDQVFFTVHYTNEANRRFDLWLDADGQNVSHLLTVLQPSDRNYMRDELGR